jgi:hypothetical protein
MLPIVGRSSHGALPRYARWKAALAAAVLTLTVGAGFAVSSAHADSSSFEVRYESGQFVLYNISGSGLYIDDIQNLWDGDLDPQYHGFFDCMAHTVAPDEGCVLYLNGSHGTLEISSPDLAAPEDVSVSDGS